jgi:hypothetical protein
MEVFRELFIRADAQRMAAAVDEIEASLPGGWRRDRAIEAGHRSRAPFSPAFCFVCSTTDRRPAARLFLTQKNSNSFYVSNVVPTERHQLSHAEYNTILEDFFQTVWKPYAEHAGIDHELTGADAGLEHWLSSDSADKLRQFSLLANRGTGASHPNDRQRWNDFVISAYRDGSQLDASTLQRWLIEVEGWAPEIAGQLAVEYEYGRELLAFERGMPEHVAHAQHS